MRILLDNLVRKFTWLCLMAIAMMLKPIGIISSRQREYVYRGLCFDFFRLHETVCEVTIDEKQYQFTINTPNAVCLYRAETITSKEPEILDWMRQYSGKTLVDIGANIGICSLIFIKAFGGKAVCIEPSVFNLGSLALNLAANNCSQSSVIVPLPVSDKSAVGEMLLSSADVGGAMHSFGRNIGFDGNEIATEISYNQLCFALDDLGALVVPDDDFIVKVDVDGLEHFVLAGATALLTSERCLSVYVEVNENFEVQASAVTELLEAAGFRLVWRRHAPEFDLVESYANTYNQMWVKQ